MIGGSRAKRHLTELTSFAKLYGMRVSSKKFLAVFLALWLPFFSGSALAVALPMQLHGACQMHEVQHADARKSSAIYGQPASPANFSCHACGFCHLTGSGFLASQDTDQLDMLQAGAHIIPYLFSFRSITSPPFVPPPLARA
jgi:hypothetical protein